MCKRKTTPWGLEEVERLSELSGNYTNSQIAAIISSEFGTERTFAAVACKRQSKSFRSCKSRWSEEEETRALQLMRIHPVKTASELLNAEFKKDRSEASLYAISNGRINCNIFEYKRWTREEENDLAQFYCLLTDAQIAHWFYFKYSRYKSNHSIYLKAKKMGLHKELDGYYTLSECSELAGVSQQVLRKMKRRGKLKHKKIRGRVAVTFTELDRLCELYGLPYFDDPVNLKEAAELVYFSRDTIYSWLAKGYLRSVKRPDGYLISKKDLIEVAEQRSQGIKPEKKPKHKPVKPIAEAHVKPDLFSLNETAVITGIKVWQLSNRLKKQTFEGVAYCPGKRRWEINIYGVVEIIKAHCLNDYPEEKKPENKS